MQTTPSCPLRVRAPLGVDGHRSGAQMAAGHGGGAADGGAADGGDGPAGGPSSREGGSAGLWARMVQRWLHGVSARHHWATVAGGCTSIRAPGQRPVAQAPLDAAAGAALCAGRQAVPASARGRGGAPGGMRHERGDGTGPRCLGLAAQYRFCREAQSGPPPAGSGDRTAGSTRGAKARTACGSNWRCSTFTTISCLPHASLRQPLPVPEPTHGTGAARVWQPRTPAMAAGLT